MPIYRQTYEPGNESYWWRRKQFSLVVKTTNFDWHKKGLMLAMAVRELLSLHAKKWLLFAALINGMDPTITPYEKLRSLKKSFNINYFIIN